MRKGNKGLYAFIWVLELITITAFTLLMCATFTYLCTYQLNDADIAEGSFYYGPYAIRQVIGYSLNDAVTYLSIIDIAVGIAACALMVLLCVMSGHFKTNEDGSICLNRFDRIWSEIIIALGGAAFGLAICCMMPVSQVIIHMGLLPYVTAAEVDDYVFGINNNGVLILGIAGLVCCALVFIVSVISIVKKIKAHKFWEKSFIGLCFRTIRRAFFGAANAVDGSEKLTRKYVAVLIAMVLLAMTWIGAIVDLALIIYFVPKKIRKYREIADGVEEVRNGNLEYKIPIEYTVKSDAKKFRKKTTVSDEAVSYETTPASEFDRLAEGINEISAASHIAVQNEIKNQRMKTDLISNVSHDLKTPLTSMLSYVDLLKKEGLDSENAEEYLGIIDEKTQRLKNLTENLFEAAKASSGNIPCTISEIDMSAIVTQALAEMDERLSDRGLKVIVKNDCVNSTVKADGQLLWRVIENLLSNVSKYALEGSRVYVNLSERANSVLLDVKNISKDELNISADELMERFKRGDESRNTEGSGLGLAIAKDLTKIMGGVFELAVDGDLFKASVMLNKA